MGWRGVKSRHPWSRNVFLHFFDQLTCNGLVGWWFPIILIKPPEFFFHQKCFLPFPKGVILRYYSCGESPQTLLLNNSLLPPSCSVDSEYCSKKSFSFLWSCPLTRIICPWTPLYWNHHISQKVNIDIWKVSWIFAVYCLKIGTFANSLFNLISLKFAGKLHYGNWGQMVVSAVMQWDEKSQWRKEGLLHISRSRSTAAARR